MSAHIPIGYKVENGVPVVDDEKATAVRNLFIFYISGYSLNNAALTKFIVKENYCKSQLVPKWNKFKLKVLDRQSA